MAGYGLPKVNTIIKTIITITNQNKESIIINLNMKSKKVIFFFYLVRMVLFSQKICASLPLLGKVAVEYSIVRGMCIYIN